MKLTKQINKKLTKTIAGYKLLKHIIKTTKILEYKTFTGLLRLKLKPYSLICLCCQDLLKVKKSVKFVVPTVTCDTENEVRWKISPSGGVVNNVDQICKILHFSSCSVDF